MQEYEEIGHMEVIPVKEVNKTSAKSYCLPPHAVLKESSTTTICE